MEGSANVNVVFKKGFNLRFNHGPDCCKWDCVKIKSGSDIGEIIIVVKGERPGRHCKKV